MSEEKDVTVGNLGAQVSKDVQNRALDTQVTDSPISITLLTIDETLINYLNTKIHPTVIQDGDKIEVPVMYASPERWHSVQKDGVYRDKFNKIQIPLIMLHRVSMKKHRGIHSQMNKYLEREFDLGWNRYNPYDKFAILNNIEPVKKRIVTVTPDYFKIQYKCIIWTEYMEQMNGIIEQISFEDDEYWGERGKYKFRATIDEYKTNVKLPDTEDRLVKTEFDMTVDAYLLPEKLIDEFGNLSKSNQTRYTTKRVITIVEAEG
jgi:hypothetical protein